MKVKTLKKIVRVKLFINKMLPCIGILLCIAVSLIAGYWLSEGAVKMYRHLKLDYSYELTDRFYCKSYEDGTKSVVVKETGRKVGRRYAEVVSNWGDDSTVLVTNKRKQHGLLSSITGKLMIPCRYCQIWPSDNNLVACYNKKRVIDFWDCAAGKKMFSIRTGVEYDEVSSMDIRYENNVCIVPLINYQVGLIDTNGKFLFMDCDNITAIDSNRFIIRRLINGNKLESGLFVYDSTRLRCIVNGFDDMYPTAIGILCKKNGKSVLIDNTRAILSDCLLSVALDGGFSKTLKTLTETYATEKPNKKSARTYTSFYQDDLMGVYDEQCNVVIEPRFGNVAYLGNDLFLCELDDYAHCIIMDKNQTIIKLN